MNLAKYIDHTILVPNCTINDIKKVCEEAVFYKFAGVCIPPYFVKEAHRVLGNNNNEIKIITVIGFPMGYCAVPAKVEEAKRAIDEGADEIDMVINICAVKAGNWGYVRNDIDSVTRAAHLRGKVVKIILEMTLLTDAEIIKLCAMCAEFGVNFVKTSTGFNGGATVEMVKLLRENLPKSVKIKASGGIKTREAVDALIAAGADRIGTSSGVLIIS